MLLASKIQSYSVEATLYVYGLCVHIPGYVSVAT